MLIDISQIPNSHLGGVGFAIVNTHGKIVVVGYIRINATCVLDAELQATKVGLKDAADQGVNIATIFTNCTRLKQVPKQTRSDNIWRTNQRIRA